jgi:hypothetical protein
MAYTLKLTNGKILLNLSDQKTDELTTSVTLIGKNVSAYGGYYNTNFIHLLENFASPSQPRSPLVGQLWYNTALGRMFVYNQTNQFKPVGGPIVSPTIPTNVVAGELWLDTVKKQLQVYDGTNFITAGPIYDTTQGKAGWVVEEILGDDVVTYTVSSLYNNNVLLAILSEVSFTPAVPYQGIAQVNAGLTFNNSISGIQVTATATNSTAIAGINSSQFLRNDTNQTIDGQFTVLNNGGLQVGLLNNIQLYVDSLDNDASTIYSAYPDASLKLVVTGASIGTTTGLYINPVGRKMGVWTETPATALDIAGDLTVRGSLLVQGAATNITTENLAVENINIELASPAGSLPDASIEGGGIILHGTVDHSLVFRNATPGWELSNNLNLVASKGYYINNTKVIDNAGVYVATAPNLTSVGLLTTLNVGNLVITTSTISTADGLSDLVLAKQGVGNVSVSGKKIVDLAPNTPFDSTSTAVTKYYVDTLQSLKNSTNFVFSLDVTGVQDVNLFVIQFLDKMLPLVNDPLDTYYIPEQARCRVNCMNYAIPSWTVTGNNNYATDTVDKDNVPSSISVLTAVTVQVTSPVTFPVSSQEVRQFYAIARQWVYDQVIV